MTVNNDELHTGLDSLPLLQVLRVAQNAESRQELAHVAVNESYNLAKYSQAALWLSREGVAAFSGVSQLDINAPYTQFIASVCRRIHASVGVRLVRLVRPSDLSDKQLQQWSQWLPAQVLQLQLPPRGAFQGGLLLLGRDEPWTPREMAQLSDWSRILSHEFASLTSGSLLSIRPLKSTKEITRFGRLSFLRVPRVWFSLGVLLILSLPVRLSVLAPAELVPRDPKMVRSPLEGVVERILVAPNELVVAGQPLIEFDRVSLRNRLAVARHAIATTRVEYRQKSQLALMDEDGRAALAILAGRIREQEGEIAHLEELANRSVINSPAQGVAIFDNASEWRGRPVVIGERIMAIADENSVEIEAWVSPADMIPLQSQASINLYLNADPLQPLVGRLRYLAHKARERPDGTYAYRARASLLGSPANARIGLKGTAKLSGERVPFLYWLIRRPMAAFRAWLGV